MPSNKQKGAGILFRILTLIALCVLGSCANKAEHEVPGLWVVSKLSENGEDITPLLSRNLMTLKENHSCSLPVLNGSEDLATLSGTWDLMVSERKKILVVNSRNPLFHTSFQIDTMWVEPYPNKKGNFVWMKLSSGPYKMSCFKDVMLPED